MEVFAALVAAIVAAPLTWLVATRTDRSRLRYETTARLVSEYLSREMLEHKVAVAALRRRLAGGAVEIECVAAGFWFPGRPDFHGQGDPNDAAEHEHLEVLLGWYKQAGYLLTRNMVDEQGLKTQVGASLAWSASMIGDLLREIRRQAEEDGYEPPGWLPAVTRVQDLVSNPRALDSSAEELRAARSAGALEPPGESD